MPIKKYSENRPWGGFERFTLNELSTVKLLTVKPNEALSLQSHHAREEFWRVISGNGTVTLGSIEIPAKTGEEFSIPPETNHRLAAGPEGIVVLEVALGTFDENDEVRISDSYGRSSPKT